MTALGGRFMGGLTSAKEQRSISVIVFTLTNCIQLYRSSALFCINDLKAGTIVNDLQPLQSASCVVKLDAANC